MRNKEGMESAIIHCIALLILMLAYCCKEKLNQQPVSNSIIKKIQKSNFYHEVFDLDTIALELPDSLAIGEISAIHFLENNKIVISDVKYAKTVLLFDEQGSFIKTIGRTGQGPGEYNYPKFLNSTSKGDLIVGDKNLRRVTFYDNKDFNYSYSFQFEHAIGAMAVGRGDYIAIQNTEGNWVTNTIWLYDNRGKILAKFGRRSETVEKMWKILPFTTQGPHVCFSGDYILETDYGDYHIRKYNLRGEHVTTFGQEPIQWRSLQPEKYSAIPLGVMTPDKIQKMNRILYEKIDRCSIVWSIYAPRKGLVALLINNRPKSGFSKEYFFDIYTSDGMLVKSGLQLTGFPGKGSNPRVHLQIAQPDRLVLIRYFDAPERINEKIELIVYK